MVRPLFVLGCSGSGKSTISRCIKMLARDRGWLAHFMSDYTILYEMFQADTKKQFRNADHQGFDVYDDAAYDAALGKLNEQAQALVINIRENKLVIIEFARCDYREALKHFDGYFVRTGHFLFLDADVKTCKDCIRERVARAQSLDDHFVPDYVVERFGQKSCKQYIETGLKQDYDLTDDRVHILDTIRPIEEVFADVERFVERLLPIPIAANL